METLFYRMITNGLIVLALLPAVWLLCRAFRKQPATQNLLWLLLLAKLTLAPILIWSFSFESELIEFLARKEPEVVAPVNTNLNVSPATQSAANADSKKIANEVVDPPAVITIQPEPVDNSISEPVEPQINLDPMIEEADAQVFPQISSQSLANNEPMPKDAPKTAPIIANPSVPAPEQAKIAAASVISPLATESPPQKASAIPLLTSILKIIRSPEVIWGGSVIWLGGCLVFGLNAARKLRATRNLIKNSLPGSPELTQISQEVAKNFRIKRIEVREVDRLDSPCVVAFGRARILWPAEMNPTAQGCRAIMAHEIVHIKRRDHWAMWLEMIAGVMWWWNPACHYIRRRLHETRELACDAVALAQLGEEPGDYAQKLIDLTTGQSFRASRHLPACSVGAVSKNSLQRRLVMLFEDRIVGRTSRMGLLVALLITGLVLPTFVLGEPKEPERKQQPVPLVAETSSEAASTDKEEIEKVATEFTNALREGDYRKTESFLTRASLESTRKANMGIQPIGSPKHSFKILDTNIFPLEKGKQGAHVSCEITDIDRDGTERKHQHIWALRHTNDGWRVAGEVVQPPHNQETVLLDFENAEEMKVKLEEIAKRAKQNSNDVISPKKNTIQPFDTFTLEYAISDKSTQLECRVSSNGVAFIELVQSGPNRTSDYAVTARIVGLTILEAEKKLQEAITKELVNHTGISLSNVGVQITNLMHHSNRLAEFEKNRKAVIQNGDVILIENENGAPKGNFTVEEEGTLALGARFGRVAVAGRTVDEATEILFEHLSKKNKNLDPTFSLRYFKKPAAPKLDDPPAATPLVQPGLPPKAQNPGPNPFAPAPPNSLGRATNPGPSTNNPLNVQLPPERPAKRYEFRIKFFSGDPKGSVKDGTIKVLQAPKITADEGQTVYCHEGSDPGIVVPVPQAPGFAESVIYDTTGRTVTVRTMGEAVDGKIKLQIHAVVTKSRDLKEGKAGLTSSSTMDVIVAKFGEPNKIEFPSDFALLRRAVGATDSNWAEVTVTEAPAETSASSIKPQDAKKKNREFWSFNDSASSPKLQEADNNSAAHKIQPGDKLSIKCEGVTKDGAPDGNFTVEPGGTVPLGPMFGRVKVAGLTIEEAEKAVVAVLKKFYNEPLVQITMDFNVRKSRQLMLERSENLVKFSTLATEIAKKKLEKLTEANRVAPGSVSPIEIDETRLTLERSLLEAKQAQIENELLKMGKDIPSSNAKNLPSKQADTRETLEQSPEMLQVELEASLRTAQAKQAALLKKLKDLESSATRPDSEPESTNRELQAAELEVKRAQARLDAAKRLANEKGSPAKETLAPGPGPRAGY